jgi:hypothetical protein
MGGRGADQSPEASAGAIRRTLAGLSHSDQAAFLNYDGEPIGW